MNIGQDVQTTTTAPARTELDRNIGEIGDVVREIAVKHPHFASALLRELEQLRDEQRIVRFPRRAHRRRGPRGVA